MSANTVSAFTPVAQFHAPVMNPEGSKIPKAWGEEQIYFNNDNYCLKSLRFDKAGNHFSCHFHKNKKESWLVMKGSFTLTTIDTETAEVTHQELKLGDRVNINPLVPHKLTALEDYSIIMEVSTPDFAHDNYRVAKGMSQLT